MGGKGIFMSAKEQVTYRIIEDFRAGKICRKEAAAILGLSERTVSRKAESVRVQGMGGVKHGNRLRVPSNKSPDSLRKRVLQLIRDKYFDFNLVHALELLSSNESIQASYATAYRWCKLAGVGKRIGRRRPSKVRVCRERMANEGLMLQMDGSHHAWNGADKWCLIALIDDATSDIPFAQFFETETTFGCMRVLRAVIELRGIPDIIYTDYAGWSGNGKRVHFSHFKAACEELGIRVVSTSSPESKGRIERAWGTIQDRLIPELRIHNIKGMMEANSYLQHRFLPNYWKKRNTVQPINQTTRYKPLPAHINLDQVFCLKYERIVAKNHTVWFANQRYQIRPHTLGSLRGKPVTVHEYEDQTISIFYGHIKLDTHIIKANKRARVA